MKLNWINVKNRMPRSDQEVFVLFGSNNKKDSDLHERPNITIGTWADGIDDFVDSRLQQQYSYHWMPISKYYKDKLPVKKLPCFTCVLCNKELLEEPEQLPDHAGLYWTFFCDNKNCSLYLKKLAELS